jgi:hypothetical protein
VLELFVEDPEVPLPFVPEVPLPVPPEEEGLFVSEPLPLVDPLPLVELPPEPESIITVPPGGIWMVPLVLEGGVV